MCNRPESSLNHRLDAIYSLELEHCDLKVWREEQKVEELRYSRAREPKLPCKPCAIRNQSLVDQSLEVMPEGEHARDLRGAAHGHSSFGWHRRPVGEFDTSPLSPKQRAFQDEPVLQRLLG